MVKEKALKEFNENMKYVIGMVATQWVSLLANVGMMLVMAAFVAEIITAETTGVQVEAVHMKLLLIVFAAAFAVRMLATTFNTKQSFAASENVKRGLREKVYKKSDRPIVTP